MTDIAHRLQDVKNRIAAACARSGRLPELIKLIVVTKSASFEQIIEAIKLRCTELGESRVQQLKKVSDEIAEYFISHKSEFDMIPAVKWHMIGHLQRNKVRTVLPIASIIHSVDTLRLAEEIHLAATKLEIKPKILLQVNASEEPQKFGVYVGAVVHLVEQIATLSNISLAGLTAIGPLTNDTGAIRACFARMHELFLEIKNEKIAGPEFTELSMGMSNDFEIAIEEGATILRIGSAIFAP